MTFIINASGKKCKTSKKCDSLVSQALVDFRRKLKSGKMSMREENILL
jgi:hypothetical protein